MYCAAEELKTAMTMSAMAPVASKPAIVSFFILGFLSLQIGLLERLIKSSIIYSSIFVNGMV